MSDLKFIQAFVDFRSSLPLRSVADMLSEQMFAGIRFVGQNEGILDEVPAMRLEHDFLGLRVVLGGGAEGNSGFTLEMELADFPWDKIPENETRDSICDISETIKAKLKEFNNIEIIDKHAD